MKILTSLLQGMSYNTPQFILFLAVFLTAFFLVRRDRLKLAVIIAANIVFYRYVGGPGQLVIVAVIALIVYSFSIVLGRMYEAGEKEKPEGLSLKQDLEYWKEYKKKTRVVLIAGIVMTLFTLIYTKVGHVFGFEIISDISQLSFRKLIVPLGLSYFTFSSVGYLIDIYKRKITPTGSFPMLFACLTFFPIIVEGPISKYNKLIEQFRSMPEFDYDRFCRGLQRMLYGLFKKMVLADRISPYTGMVFADVFSYSGPDILIALILSVFSLYADFSGCMDIVIGLAQAMGFELEENFRQPLLSPTISEFWRRWHITLFSWFRDYIYMPIAKSSGFKKLTKKTRGRFGKQAGQTVAMAFPMFLVWIITGLWHGTGKDYIAWGLYWAVLTFVSMLLEPYSEMAVKKLKINTESSLWNAFRIFRTDVLYLISAMFVMTSSSYGLHGFIYLTRQLFSKWNGSRFWVKTGMDLKDIVIIVLSIGLLTAVDCLNNKGICVREKIAGKHTAVRWFIWLVLLYTVLILGKYGPGYSAAEFFYRGF